ncbi:MAG: 4-hydroxy-tetrahydrodipicolinate reductase [Bacteroidia bacterium]|nr:4-hydroxy-tetrahydrodipicolinate reductase [Bacteroidia bacterium]MBT8278191.1 4-hydroxy-tetrahydrodipicolinate reductase [Bacteroidia bacterium]NNK58987.1 4-hydroxy-tetrahydrodipicolinate reductase [Flavobacteriaceae bacterium]NNL32112.1 4-hydroxy-tetrahydrodipicolinate reductase [Flavobacteriaceae bacterium]RZW55565.1 MAG: 4-hydroxy-tetrahydrodipicolinate reductase [Flavobacteriaceae bacterium]
MRIALLGYGKMGKTIEKIAMSRGHSIVLKITEESEDYNIALADIAIDFSVPSAAVDNISNCLRNGVPVVCGTTGWLKDYNSIINLCKETDGAFIYASNFSLGVNIFFELNSKLAAMMSDLKDYNASIEEIHHTQKLDAPSGTAISLAEGIIENTDYTSWELDPAKGSHEIPISAKRVKDVPGTHSVSYSSKVDSIEIRHEAYSRDGFALGAVVAAEWLLGKTGIFTMKDVLNIG